jgi:hypothetical protein
MNMSIKAGIAGALALAGVAAHATIAQPSSGASDAILFAEVVNSAGTKLIASYAGDTGLSIASFSSLSGTKTVLGSDANLAALFAADTAGSGDQVLFSVQGGQFTSDPGTYITTTTNNNTGQLHNVNTNVLFNSFQGIDGDVGTINGNLSNSTFSVEAAAAGSAGNFDTTNTASIAFWDGGEVATANTANGTADNLYKVVATNPNSLTSPATYTLEGTASLTSAGLVIAAGTPPTVPLPAAVWLLGSGLLGLTGVARRKLKV